MPHCLFERSTGLFLGGAMYDSPIHNLTLQIVLDLPAYPDPRADRWDGAAGTRAATAQELADYDAALAQAREQRDFDGAVMLRAVALVVADLHGLTPQQIRTQILTKYRSLS